MSTLAVNTIQAQTGTTVSVPSSQVLHAPGHVIQVVQAVTDTEVAVNTAATWTSLMTGTITPKFSSSKIMIMCSGSSLQRSATTIGYKVTRGSTDLVLQAMYSDDSDWAGNSLCLNYLDSPATTSAITYTWMGYNHSAGDGLWWNYDNSELESTNASITLMEIAQ
tara:strand:+ start:444 stop:938 length:495 start_codon:yes stop_codon:yes gene_type:complete